MAADYRPPLTHVLSEAAAGVPPPAPEGHEGLRVTLMMTSESLEAGRDRWLVCPPDAVDFWRSKDYMEVVEMMPVDDHDGIVRTVEATAERLQRMASDAYQASLNAEDPESDTLKTAGGEGVHLSPGRVQGAPDPATGSPPPADSAPSADTKQVSTVEQDERGVYSASRARELRKLASDLSYREVEQDEHQEDDVDRLVASYRCHSDREALIERAAAALWVHGQELDEKALGLEPEGRIAWADALDQEQHPVRLEAQAVVDALAGDVPSGGEPSEEAIAAAAAETALIAPGMDGHDAAVWADSFTFVRQMLQAAYAVDAQPEREDGEPTGAAGRESGPMVHRCSHCMTELFTADRGYGSTALACPTHAFDRQIVTVPAWVEEAAKAHPDTARRYVEQFIGADVTQDDCDEEDAWTRIKRELREARAEVERWRQSAKVMEVELQAIHDAIPADVAGEETVELVRAVVAELRRLRASKPLSTDVLRNPPLDLCIKADHAVSGPFGFVTPAKATRATQAVFGVLAGWLDEHSPPSLSEQSGDGPTMLPPDFAAAVEEQIGKGVRPLPLYYGQDSQPGQGWVTPTGLAGQVNLLVPLESESPPLAPPPISTARGPYVGVTVKLADLAALLPSPAVGLTVEALTSDDAIGALFNYVPPLAEGRDDDMTAGEAEALRQAVREMVAAVSEGPDEDASPIPRPRADLQALCKDLPYADEAVLDRLRDYRPEPRTEALAAVVRKVLAAKPMPGSGDDNYRITVFLDGVVRREAQRALKSYDGLSYTPGEGPDEGSDDGEA